MDFTAYSLLVLLVLLTVFGLARLTGYRRRHRRLPRKQRSPEQDYFVGLNYLLNDEPDDAIDVFINSLELNTDTLETHLALCTLLRRRGKVDRSISHCQHLLASQRFSARDLGEIKINLVRSYIAAGLLDRAERLLEELKQTPPPVREAALILAITVYQIEKDWPQAAAVAQELLKICNPARKAELQLQTSHFFCEMAEAALALGNPLAARDELRKAAAISRNNVRVCMLLGKVEAMQGNFREAVRALQKVQECDHEFAGEVGAQLLDYLVKAGMEKQLGKLLEVARTGTPGTGELLALTDVIGSTQGNQAALAVLQVQMRKNPSLALLERALEAAARLQGAEAPLLAQGAELLQKQLQNCARYRCENCGFELRNLYWLCPGCSKWGTVKPLEGRLMGLQSGLFLQQQLRPAETR
jgi:lipopolysaccharide biosynthesis regulator YciM